MWGRAIVVASVLLALLVLVTPAQAQDGGKVYIPRMTYAATLVHVPVINHAWDTSILGLGTGWLEQTNWIGDTWGRVVIAGHSYGAFQNLPLVQIGDMIVVWDAAQIQRYEVVSAQIVPVKDLRWVMPTIERSLAVITCAGDQRLVLVAKPM